MIHDTLLHPSSGNSSKASIQHHGLPKVEGMRCYQRSFSECINVHGSWNCVTVNSNVQSDDDSGNQSEVEHATFSVFYLNKVLIRRGTFC